MDIDLSVLRMMEREKEIPFDELVQIIEQAILMAYLKHTNPAQHGHANPRGARAHLDRKTGHVSIFVPEYDENGDVIGEAEDSPSDFGWWQITWGDSGQSSLVPMICFDIWR